MEIKGFVCKLVLLLLVAATLGLLVAATLRLLVAATLRLIVCCNLAAHCLLQSCGLCAFVCKLDFSLLVAACWLQTVAACLLQTATACLLQLTASTHLHRFDIFLSILYRMISSSCCLLACDSR